MKRGFTLIELLVVIAIIGLLSSIVLASLNTARAKARDAQRRSDLHQIAVALELYYSAFGTYAVANTGYVGNSGTGYYNNSDPSGSFYATTSIADGLKNSGFIHANIMDPKATLADRHTQYLVNICNGNLFLYATLENPSPKDLATVAANTPAKNCLITLTTDDSNSTTLTTLNYSIGS